MYVVYPIEVIFECVMQFNHDITDNLNNGILLVLRYNVLLVFLPITKERVDTNTQTIPSL